MEGEERHSPAAAVAPRISRSVPGRLCPEWTDACSLPSLPFSRMWRPRPRVLSAVPGRGAYAALAARGRSVLPFRLWTAQCPVLWRSRRGCQIVSCKRSCDSVAAPCMVSPTERAYAGR